MNSVSRNATAALLALAAMLWGDDACAGTELVRHEYAQVIMGMDFKLIFYAPDSDAAKLAADEAFQRVSQLDAILSDYNPRSELSRLTATAGTDQWIAVSPDLWRVLQPAQALAESTEGAFDVTAGPLIQLWRRARRQSELPSPQRLAAARPLVGFRLLELDLERQQALLTKAGMRLDLGGIAAGYAVDEALRILHAHDVTSALVDCSGDVAVSASPPASNGWRIAIPHPAPDAGTIYVQLTDRAIAHSGDTEQFVEVDGTRYSHIVDPRTGLGLINRLGVTVIAPTCLQADALATAVSVLGIKAGLQLIADTPGAECRIVQVSDDSSQVHSSAGWRIYEVASP